MNRVLLALLCLCSPVMSGPFVVTKSPRYVVTSPGTSPQKHERSSSAHQEAAGSSLPVCVTIAGVDHDLKPLLAEYRRAWTWPGEDESSLRRHLAEHQVSGIERLSFDQLRKIHAVIHERELLQKPVSVPISQPRVMQSNCPGGVCPAPQSWGSGLFGRRARGRR